MRLLGIFLNLTEFNYILIFAILFIVYFVLRILVLAMHNSEVTVNNLIFVMVLLSFAMAIVAFHLCPLDDGPDINRHFNDYERELGLLGDTAKQFMELKYSAMGLFGWIGLLKLSVFLGDKHYLPAIAVLINYLFYTMSCVVVVKNNKVTYRQFLLYLICKIGLVSYFHLFSGIRNVLAFSILGYAILLSVYNEKNKTIKIIICMLLACSVHLTSYIVIFFFVVYKLKVRIEVKNLLLMLWSFASMVIVNILRFLPISVLKSLGDKLNYYFGLFRAIDMRLTLVCIVYFIIIMIKEFLLNQNEFINSDRCFKKYTYFLSIINSFLIGSILIPTILMRIIYLMGFIAFPLFIFTKKYLIKRDYLIFTTAEILLCTLMASYNFVSINSHMYLV